ncbi:threonine ammonia-lyase [Carboxydothermus ferrireducens]|uniref:L-threonine dehydratase catabolic TdcB n=1 Tax=Carboxydothermus ferrireducens DSM 11255 TaxID=1119529 RepID=A0ABX2RA01_9THEO|nr:threonine ammonia-lyase [Carboxydothermus ferrireducens]NYE57397.1 threonine dehydratase [Carboxydothermus ferrireducens DSM 11255]
MVEIKDVQEARIRLLGVAHRTLTAYSATFSRLAGAEVYFKYENLQKTGSFKLRGAYNKIASLPVKERERGVVAASAGNHAQGVAFASFSAGIPATIVMPEGAPLAKIQATQSYGAKVILHGVSYDDAFLKAKEIMEKEGATFVHAFDDPKVIAGQGTIALEMLEDVPELDMLVAPVGGGGLIAGLAVAAKAIKPHLKVIGVQAKGAPSAYASLKERRKVTLASVSTIADGIAVKTPGELTSKIIFDLVDDIVLVDDEEIAQAILMMLERGKVMLEGAGAVGVAALLAQKIPVRGHKVGVVLSGGNIDVHTISIIIERGLVKSGRYVRIKTILDDKPGALQKLLELIAREKANIIFINHDRIAPHVPIKQAEVELALETRDLSHIEKIMAVLREAGYQILQN